VSESDLEDNADHSAGLHAVDKLSCTLRRRLRSRLTNIFITTHKHTHRLNSFI